MKHVKMLSLALVAVAALMAFVGASSASATVLCKTKVNAKGNCPASWGYSGEIHAASEEEPVLTGGIINIHCKESTVAGNTTEGTATKTETPNGAVTVLTFGPESTCNCKVVVVKTGTLEIHVIGDTGNGTLTSNGATVETTCNTIFGTVKCYYVTENTDLGTLTGSTTTKGAATMDITATIPRESPSSELCNEEAIWHAKYTVTTPTTLDVATATE